jgi:hypothetical protein
MLGAGAATVQQANKTATTSGQKRCCSPAKKLSTFIFMTPVVLLILAASEAVAAFRLAAAHIAASKTHPA